MIGQYRRYAVYYAPPAFSALAYAGAMWFGHDPELGPMRASLAVEGLPAPRETLVRRARRYGFHATLKAPFALAPGVAPEALDNAMIALSSARQPVMAPPLEVMVDDGFVALRPGGPSEALDALAAACVTELDPLRAPLSAVELSQRRRMGLDAQEDIHLQTWGYPFVLDRFRFHITLTGALARVEAEQAADALRAALAPALGPVFIVGAISLFGDPGEDQPFRLLRRYPLSGR